MVGAGCFRAFGRALETIRVLGHAIHGISQRFPAQRDALHAFAHVLEERPSGFGNMFVHR